MATAAQIEANRRNAQSSTGPKTDMGKARVRRNAFKHGMTARTIMPVLTQEDSRQLDERTDRWTNDVQPRNAIEYDLVVLAARLAHAVERGERIETAHLAGRVRQAGREQTQKPNARQRKQVRELGRRLLYIAGPEEVKVSRMPLWDDDPGLLVSELEESAAGCRWLLERWAEYRNLLDRKANWNTPVLLRFIRLQGKNVVESVYDPALNSIFLAWDVLVPKYAKEGWHLFQEVKPRTDPAFNHRLVWCEIAPRPSDPAEAWAVLYAVVNQHVGRLEELLARNEASEAAEDPDWADRAALDCSPEFERHRRYQSAKTRELLRTLDTLRRMREFGTRNLECGKGNGEGGMADDKCQMANDKCQMADDKCQMANDKCQMADDKCQMADDKCQMAGVAGGELGDEQCEVEAGGCAERPSSEPMTEGSSGPVGGHDSNRVIDDSTNDKIGILSHQGARAAGQPGQGDGVGQCLPANVTTPQKAPNKANFESTHSLEAKELKSEAAGAEGQKQSQSSQGETTRKPRSRDGRPARQSGRRPAASGQ